MDIFVIIYMSVTVAFYVIWSICLGIKFWSVPKDESKRKEDESKRE